jgi:hypothetical protein
MFTLMSAWAYVNGNSVMFWNSAAFNLDTKILKRCEKSLPDWSPVLEPRLVYSDVVEPHSGTLRTLPNISLPQLLSAHLSDCAGAWFEKNLASDGHHPLG